MNSDDKGVVWEASELSKKFSMPVSKFINGVLRNYLRNKDEDIENLKRKEKFDILYSTPKWFCELLEEQYDRFRNTIKSLKKIPYLALRVNKLKYSERI